jgi:hypothetical protein
MCGLFSPELNQYQPCCLRCQQAQAQAQAQALAQQYHNGGNWFHGQVGGQMIPPKHPSYTAWDTTAAPFEPRSTSTMHSVPNNGDDNNANGVVYGNDTGGIDNGNSVGNGSVHHHGGSNENDQPM